MSSDDKKKAKKKCTSFEPQAWRRTLCKNCFLTEAEHKALRDEGHSGDKGSCETPSKAPRKEQEKNGEKKDKKAADRLENGKPDIKKDIAAKFSTKKLGTKTKEEIPDKKKNEKNGAEEGKIKEKSSDLKSLFKIKSKKEDKTEKKEKEEKDESKKSKEEKAAKKKEKEEKADSKKTKEETEDVKKKEKDSKKTKEDVDDSKKDKEEKKHKKKEREVSVKDNDGKKEKEEKSRKKKEKEDAKKEEADKKEKVKKEKDIERKEKAKKEKEDTEKKEKAKKEKGTEKKEKKKEKEKEKEEKVDTKKVKDDKSDSRKKSRPSSAKKEEEDKRSNKLSSVGKDKPTVKRVASPTSPPTDKRQIKNGKSPSLSLKMGVAGRVASRAGTSSPRSGTPTSPRSGTPTSPRSVTPTSPDSPKSDKVPLVADRTRKKAESPKVKSKEIKAETGSDKSGEDDKSRAESDIQDTCVQGAEDVPSSDACHDSSQEKTTDESHVIEQTITDEEKNKQHSTHDMPLPSVSTCEDKLNEEVSIDQCVSGEDVKGHAREGDDVTLSTDSPENTDRSTDQYQGQVTPGSHLLAAGGSSDILSSHLDSTPDAGAGDAGSRQSEVSQQPQPDEIGTRGIGEEQQQQQRKQQQSQPDEQGIVGIEENQQLQQLQQQLQLQQQQSSQLQQPLQQQLVQQQQQQQQQQEEQEEEQKKHNQKQQESEQDQSRHQQQQDIEEEDKNTAVGEAGTGKKDDSSPEVEAPKIPGVVGSGDSVQEPGDGRYRGREDRTVDGSEYWQPAPGEKLSEEVTELQQSTDQHLQEAGREVDFSAQTARPHCVATGAVEPETQALESLPETEQQPDALNTSRTTINLTITSGLPGLAQSDIAHLSTQSEPPSYLAFQPYPALDEGSDPVERVYYRSGETTSDSSDPVQGDPVQGHPNSTTPTQGEGEGEGQEENVTSLFHHLPDGDPGSEEDWSGSGSEVISPEVTSQGHSSASPLNRAIFVRRRRRRGHVRERDPSRLKMEVDAGDSNISRNEAMMEGTRMLMEDLKEKIAFLEKKNDKLLREKSAVSELLLEKKEDYVQMEDHYRDKVHDLDDQVKRLSSEKTRLMDRLRLPESERAALTIQDNQIAMLQRKLDEAENLCLDYENENLSCREEIKDLQLEMEEMHDQFREEEAMEFRELQKELEATAKNCRILQFKLRKADRRNEQQEHDRLQMEDKLRQLEGRFASCDDKQQIRELEEDVKMAKEVSVRLHDELEMVEERRARYEEELDRVNDMLTESESRRKALQVELQELQDETEKLKEEQMKGDKGNGNDVTQKKKDKPPTLSKAGKQSSADIDVAELMRDLSDSLERETDLKDQLKFAEEEIRIMRKKLCDMDEENESLNLQLQKMSSARSGKYFKKGPGGRGEKEVVTEREHELRIQMELAEQELKVLHRKMDEMGQENEALVTELNALHSHIQEQSTGNKTHDARSYEDRIKGMADDIDKLKWKLITQDHESDRTRKGKPTLLQKSRSLDTDSIRGNEPPPQQQQQQHDARRQLDTVQQEVGVLREKLVSLEGENESLQEENRRLQLQAGRKAPAVTTDDAALQNIELKDGVKKLEQENAVLRKQLTTLDRQANKLSREVVSRKKIKSESCLESESAASRDLRKQLRALEDETKRLRKKMAEVETQNAKLDRDLQRHKKKEAKNNKEKREGIDELKDKLLDLESETRHLRSVIQNREDELKKLEEEIDVYRTDIDKLLDDFQGRERELLDEITSLQQKNEIVSNLLELVTDRAEAAQKELERSPGLVKSDRRSGSAVSALSNVSSGSDDVFVQPGDDSNSNVVVRDWEGMLEKRIDTLEQLLAEERQKVGMFEDKVTARNRDVTAVKEELLLQKNEKDIVQQELELCQKQLSNASNNLQDLKDRLEEEQDAHGSMKELNTKVSKQLEEEQIKRKQEKEKEEKSQGKAASWRWEKQDLERQLKEGKKKVEDLHAEVKRQQFKWKMAGEDIEKEHLKKQQLEKQIEDLKTECEKHKTEITGNKKQVEELLGQLKSKEETWRVDRQQLESDKQSSERELRQKNEAIKKKDDIIKQKDELVKKKDNALKERDGTLANTEKQLKASEDKLTKTEKSLKEKEDEARKATGEAKEAQTRVHDLDGRVRSLTEEVRSRDERIKEKNDILEQINLRMADKDSKIKDLDKSMKSSEKKLSEREAECTDMRHTVEKADKELKQLRDTVRMAKDKLGMAEQEHSKELSSAVIQREKLDKELSKTKKEKATAEQDLKTAKEQYATKEQRMVREKNKVDLELKQANEKIHSNTMSRTMRESDVVRTLTREKDGLIADKHKLSEEVKKLGKDAKESATKWTTEKKDLNKTIQEKTRVLEEKNARCEQLQSEISKIQTSNVAIGNASPKLIPIPVRHETTHTSRDTSPSSDWSAEKTQLLAKIEQQDLMLKAEASAQTELKDAKLKQMDDTLAHAQNQVTILRQENDRQVELLQSSRHALSDLRSRYDKGLEGWTKEKNHLEKRIKQTETALKENESLEKTISQLKTDLLEQENKSREAKNRLASEKNSWNVEKSKLENAVKKGQGDAGTGPAPKVSAFRAKFEKFEGGTTAPSTAGSRRKSLPGGQLPDKDKEKDGGANRALDDSLKLVKSLQTQITDLDKARESDRKELLQKLEQSKKQITEETKAIKDRNTQLEKQMASYGDVEHHLVEAQCSLHGERERWQSEKATLHRDLDENRRSHDTQQDTINRLMVEVKKLKDLIPSLEASCSSPKSPSEGPTKSRIIPIQTVKTDKSPGKHKDEPQKHKEPSVLNVFNKALEHITKLVENFNQHNQRRKNDTKKSDLAPGFRRSLSTSEVDGSYTLVTRPADSLQMPPVGSMAAPTPSPLVRPSRSLQRALSTESGEDASALDRRSFRSFPSRPVTYRSGTQSACTSRDTSPEKHRTPRKITPYPAAPPSMIITPSHTPRREQSVERQPPRLTSDNMRELYQKLSKIDRTDSPDNLVDTAAAKAIVKERKGSVRLLTKSMSVDSGGDVPDISAGIPQRYPEYTGEYKDAPLSETLPAALRYGGLVMTPGVESLTRNMRSQEHTKPDTKKRSESLSPRSARKKFFEDYASVSSSSPAPSSAYMSWPERRSRRGDFEKNNKADAPEETKAEVSDRMVSRSPEGRQPSSSTSNKKSFFQSVKDKRKLFGAKRSTSVDSSAVHSSIARIGMQMVPPAAPCTINLPAVEATSSRRTLHKGQRAGSVDVASLFSTTSRSNTLTGTVITKAQPKSDLHFHALSTDSGRSSSVTTSGSGAPASQKPPDGTDGSVKECRDHHSSPPPSLTPKFPRPQTPPHRRPPTRWRRSMVKASDNPIPMQTSVTTSGEKNKTKYNKTETPSDKKQNKTKGKIIKGTKSAKKTDFAERISQKQDNKLPQPSSRNFSETSV